MSDSEEVETADCTEDLSSSSGSDSEESASSPRCSICMGKFRSQTVGLPDCCQHHFCFDCIQEWSRNVNSCPIDRLPFESICFKANFLAPVELRLPLEPKVEESEVDEDVTECRVCGQSDREDRLLLCDGCDQGFHLECLQPRLSEVPMGLWFCPQCPPHSAESTSTSAPVLNRLIPRTLATERIRDRIASARDRKLPQKRKATRRRKKWKRRKTKGRRSRAKSTGGKRLCRSQSDSRRSKKSGAGGGRFSPPPRLCRLAEPNSIGFVSKATVKGRLAQHLGIAKTSSAPTVGVADSFRLFGHPQQLPDIRDDSELPGTSGSVAGPSKVTTSLKKSGSDRSTSDLLQNILDGQKFLTIPSSKVEIKRDGKLEAMTKATSPAGEVEILESNIEVEILHVSKAKPAKAGSSATLRENIDNRPPAVCLTDIPLPVVKTEAEPVCRDSVRRGDCSQSVGAVQHPPGGDQHVRRRRGLLSTPPMLPDSTTNNLRSRLPAKRHLQEPGDGGYTTSRVVPSRPGAELVGDCNSRKIPPPIFSPFNTDGEEMDVDNGDSELLNSEVVQQISSSFGPGLLGPIPSPLRISSCLPPPPQSGEMAVAQLLEQNRLRQLQAAQAFPPQQMFASTPGGLSLLDQHLMLRAAGVIQPQPGPSVRFPPTIFDLSQNSMGPQLMYPSALLAGSGGSHLHHQHQLVQQQRHHNALLLHQHQQNLLDTFIAAQSADLIVDSRLYPGLLAPSRSESTPSAPQLPERLLSPVAQRKVVDSSSNQPVRPTVPPESDVPPPPPPPKSQPDASGPERVEKTTLSTVALILSSLGIADPSKISAEVLSMAVTLAKLKETASQQRQSVAPMLRTTPGAAMSSAGPGESASPPEFHQEMRKNLTDRLAEVERLGVAQREAKEVRFEPACEELANKILDREEKQSREECRKVRLEEKKRKFLAEATSTTADGDTLDPDETDKGTISDKFNRQAGVEAAVKNVLKPFYSHRKISKDEYKAIMKKCVPKIAKKTRDQLNPERIETFVVSYVNKLLANRGEEDDD